MRDVFRFKPTMCGVCNHYVFPYALENCEHCYFACLCDLNSKQEFDINIKLKKESNIENVS